MKAASLVINFCTNDDTGIISVQRYFRDFLVDVIVVDVNAILKYLLVNFIIPLIKCFEYFNWYKGVCSENGSLPRYYFNEMIKKIQERYGEDYYVYEGFLYHNPILRHLLAKIEKKLYAQLIVLPLYLKYASSSFGSTAKI